MAPNRSVKKLPFSCYYYPILALIVAGLVISVYLSYSHYRNYTDIGYSSFCALSKAVNCDTVSQSPYSIFYNVPVPVWGIIGYLFLIFLVITSASNKKDRVDLWNIIFLVSVGYSLTSIILGLVSILLVGSYCIMCVLTYAINFMVMFLSWILLRRFDSRSFYLRTAEDIAYIRKNPRRFIVGLALLAVTVLFVLMKMPPYWQMISPPKLTDLNQGLTEEGFPWIGAENPTVTVVEFSDYMCFQCKKMHHYLRQLVAKYPNHIRLVHRHFPMDHNYNPLVVEPFHTGSGKMAILAIYAQAKGKFWQVNDFLFDIASRKKDFNSRTIAQLMGAKKREVVAALENPELRLWLKHDIAVGLDLGVTGTPTYMINGKLHQGTIPTEILNELDIDK
jgi:uncharacterized membrane protein/predicted DsbA family dithiol-disulfide isomerase